VEGIDVLVVGMNNGELLKEKKSPQSQVNVSNGLVMLMLESTLTVADTILMVLLLFAQFLGAFSDSLEHFFHLTLLVGQNILKCAFDESGVPAEDWNEDPAAFFSQRNGANAAIALALHPIDQSLLVQSIDGNADRSGVEVNLGTDGIHRHWSLMEQHVKNAEIRVA
jgi:hypothetical protein